VYRGVADRKLTTARSAAGLRGYHARWSRYPRPVQTRYLLIAALVTAIVILAASLVWFLMGAL
jgi:hypothetical protein